MSETASRRTWRVVTDRDRIRTLAERHDAVPVEETGSDGAADRSTGAVDLRALPESEAAPGEQLTWEAFDDRFDATEQFVAYRPPDAEGGAPASFTVVDRAAVTGRESAATKTTDPADLDRTQLATSDTGDDEPVVFDRTESDRDGDGGPGDGTASTSEALDSAAGSRGDLVLDEINEGHSGVGSDSEDEYLVFVNDGGERLDLSGWTVENEAGRTYEFPAGTGLAPGERITLHSDAGDDTEDHLHWGTAESVWGEMGDVVTVRDEAGERVVREPYEA